MIVLYSYKRGEDIEGVFEECLFDKRYNLGNQIETTNCGISYGQFVEVLDNQSLVSDYLYFIDLKYYQIKCFLDTNPEVDCKEKFGFITSYSKDLECFTFMSKLSEKFNSSFKLKADSEYYLKTSEEQIPNIEYLYIHDSNQLPSFPKSKLSSLSIDGLNMQSIKILYEKKSFKLLPAPYETDCYDYSGSVRSQAQCFNEVLI
jgi:hypothetical protein